MDDRIELAAHIIRQADAEVALHADERNNALASLFLYDHYEGTQLGLMAGVTKNAVRSILAQVVHGNSRQTLPPRMTEEEMTRLAREYNVPHITKSPGQKLRSAGIVIETAYARRGVAVTAMQDAALALQETGTSLVEIARMAGVSRKLVWQHVAASRKRRGY
ncbi:hypothetical protein ACGFR8_31585 [Streptomyces brevispora]|uniref:hypothetical protein n=1 Tax=Streptomyces brevispora TaxID=887462 RepID=UPI0037124DDD